MREQLTVPLPWAKAHPPRLAGQSRGYSCESAVTDGSKLDHTLYAGSNPDKTQTVFAAAIKHRPRIRPTIRQRTRVLEQWPVSAR